MAVGPRFDNRDQPKRHCRSLTKRLEIHESQECAGLLTCTLLGLSATPTGLEPAASAVTGRRANQLRYGARCLTGEAVEL